MKTFVQLLMGCCLALSATCYARDWVDLRHPEGAKLQSAGDDIVFNGLPMQAFKAQYDQSLDKTLKFYLDQMEKLRPDGRVSKVKLPSGGVLLSQNVNGQFISIRLSPQTSNSSSAEMSIADFKAGKDWVRKPFEFRVGPDTEILTDIETNDSGRKGRVVAFRNQFSLESNKSDLVRDLEARGYKLDPSATIKRKNAEIMFLFGEKRDAKVMITNKDGYSSVEVVTIDNML